MSEYPLYSVIDDGFEIGIVEADKDAEIILGNAAIFPAHQIYQC